MKVFISGRDNLGWSIDQDRLHTQTSLERIGHTVVSSIWKANVIHSVWWNTVFKDASFLKRLRKKILLTCSNFIPSDTNDFILSHEFNLANKMSPYWIAPSRKQQTILNQKGIDAFYYPFEIPDKAFFCMRGMLPKESLLAKWGIPHKIVEGRLIIGSFQRDSLGSDLLTPKWQKGPELLIDLVKHLPKNKFVLLLAGPRRHYVIQACKNMNIPYYYVGNETYQDDINFNSIDYKSMNELYNLVDIYLVTSKSEAGPKAVLESAATRTFILSTDVGLSSDFLSADTIFSNPSLYKKKLYHLVNYPSPTYFQEIVSTNFARYSQLLSRDAKDRRIQSIYKRIACED
jgi:glycosyltransferase involved in cell wall biosynthesis